MVFCLVALGCGRKGDPIPRPRTAPAACVIHWVSPRILEVQLPGRDALGGRLVGLEKVRVYYVPVGNAKPTADLVLAKGQVVLERSRPNLPNPGRPVQLDLKQIGRPAGWLVAVALRIGDVVGAPSEPVPWLDPNF
ncbi:MAG: hypothetical protein P4L36_01460 [Holophaga sp.]|nr:hypothetical protein [Holophaga sp.]